MYTPHSVLPSAQRFVAAAAALRSFPWLWRRRYDVSPWRPGRCRDGWNIGRAAARNSHQCTATNCFSLSIILRIP